MKPQKPRLAVLLASTLLLVGCCALLAASPRLVATGPEHAAIQFADIGVKATADYQGDALAVTATPDGARLHCGFQKLDGHATLEGLWLESTANGGGRLRVIAFAVERVNESAGEADSPFAPSFDFVAADVSPLRASGVEVRADSRPLLLAERTLSRTGCVQLEDKLVRFIRPGLTEEYSVSVDGVRQDFVIESPALNSPLPNLNPPAGELRVELALSGARAEAAAYGAKLKLDGSGRELAYSRLRATDATGRELPARLEVLSPDRLAVRVDDANATYPVRIDPTFSDADWVSMGGIPGANSSVYAVAVDAVGNLYIGGSFNNVGGVLASRIAKWDGSAWSALGLGMNADVVALAVSGADLHAGGGFTYVTNVGPVTVVVNRIAKWDGSAWSALGLGMSSPVTALAVSGTDLYAGGGFTRATNDGPSAIIVNRIAKWNGTTWSGLGSGMNNGVTALAVSGADVYAGGYFTTAGGNTANCIAKWNGTAWSALGSGMNGTALPWVWALSVSGTALYAGGSFTNAGGVTANCIAKWNGTVWSAVGLGMNNTVNALAVSGSELYAGGGFTMAGGTAANGIAKWNGSVWSPLDAGVNGGVSALAVSGTNLYVGGNFSGASGAPAQRIAIWNGKGWSGSGMNNLVSAIALSGTNLYAGGWFTKAGGETANFIAKWDGSAWSPLGSGMNGSVDALAVLGTDLYAGGHFTTAGGLTVNRVAKWDGGAWSALGSGMNSHVYALAVSGMNLYAGGYFTMATNTDGTSLTVRGIAKWDGTSWTGLGAGIGGSGATVYALAASGADVFAGGAFSTAGGSPATNIARWNGSFWSPLGSGMGGSVRALAVSGSDLYAGGAFTTADVVVANRIAKWNGSSWSTLGLGLDRFVDALAVSGRDLYVGGEFTMATNTGGTVVTVNRIARWDGSTWWALGSGMNSNVIDLVVSGPDLYAGGKFSTAGGKLSACIAKANIIPPCGWMVGVQTSGGAVAIDCLGLPGNAYAVERATDVLFTANLTTLLTTNAPAPDGLFRCTDSSPPNATAFYRLRRP